MGQKLYARAFEQDEFLLAVGFLDVGMHVKSLTALKNFLLLGDEQQSISLVAFQEDPYKLVLLGRDYRPSRVGGANFLVNEGKVAFVSNDDAGNLRLFEYDPTSAPRFLPVSASRGRPLTDRRRTRTRARARRHRVVRRAAPPVPNRVPRGERVAREPRLCQARAGRRRQAERRPVRRARRLAVDARPRPGRRLPQAPVAPGDHDAARAPLCRAQPARVPVRRPPSLALSHTHTPW